MWRSNFTLKLEFHRLSDKTIGNNLRCSEFNRYSMLPSIRPMFRLNFCVALRNW